MNKKILIFVIIFNLLVAAGIVGYFEYTKPKVYYVDLQKIYAEFELKKELEKKIEAVNSYTTGYLDSLEVKAGALSQSANPKGNEDEYNRIAFVYQEKSKEFDTQKRKMAEEYDEQIWGQLNEYIREYGKEKKCDLIVSGNGDGSIMYADEKKDITDIMIKYVNGRYKGE